MRRHFLALFAFFLLGTLLSPQTARATGNVLLPSTSNDNSSASVPNLGIAPVTPAPNASSPAAPAPVPTPTQPIPSATNGTGSKNTVSPVAGTLPATPAPLNIKSLITSPVDDKTAAQLPPGAIRTQILHQQDSGDAIAQLAQKSPYHLAINISSQSVFGANDVKQITDKFGLTRSQIPGACIMTVRGILNTDKGSYMIYGGNAPQVQAGYDGMIKNYFMSATALCTADHLPPASGFINESGGRYVLTLQSINCPAPTRQVSQLTIKYDGSATAQCTYQ